MILLTLTLLIILLYAYFKWCYHSFKSRNIPYIPPRFPAGSSANFILRKQHVVFTLEQLYYQLKKRSLKLAAIFVFNKPAFLLADPGVTKKILIEDFPHFLDHGVYLNEKDDPLGAHLFALTGSKWKNLRAKITPVFTSGKMKGMYPFLVECGKDLVEKMEGFVGNPDGVDMRDYFSRYSIDVIGTCAFGLDCQTLRDGGDEFRNMSEKIFHSNFIQGTKRGLAILFPDFARALHVSLTGKHIETFFSNLIRSTITQRKATSYVRKDFLQLLLEIQEKDGLTFEEICAQCFVFFLGGFETSSTLTNYCLFELARNQDVQDKLRKEVRQTFKGEEGNSYEAIHGMKYLGCILNETLRKFPPASFVTRCCTKDWVDDESGIKIKKDEMVFIPIYAFQHDPEYYPDPEKFDPDRFSDENKDRLTPFTFLPFGEGPRTCIGLRFALMQARVAIAMLIDKYKFTLNEKTVLPLVFKNNSITLTPKQPIILNAEKI